MVASVNPPGLEEGDDEGVMSRMTVTAEACAFGMRSVENNSSLPLEEEGVFSWRIRVKAMAPSSPAVATIRFSSRRVSSTPDLMELWWIR